jgi:hypothetical protein
MDVRAIPHDIMLRYSDFRCLDTSPALSTKAAVYSGILAGTIHPMQVQCDTANCTWPITPTLAVCGECIESTAQTLCSDKHRRCKSTTSSGTSIEIPLLGDSNIFSVSPTNGHYHHVNSTEFAHISVFDILKLSREDTRLTGSATECSLWFCIKAYQITVEDGKINQTQLEVWNYTRFESANNAHVDEYVFVGMPDTMNIQRQSRYAVSHRALLTLRMFMNSVTEGIVEENSGTINYSSDWVEAMWNATSDVQAWIDKLCLSLTNEIRELGKVKRLTTRDYEGSVSIPQTYMSVQWRWMAYPASLIILSLYYLSHTIIEGARDRVSVWKSNTLPMLFSRIDDGILTKVADGMDIPNGLDERVGKVRVELSREADGGWVFKPLDKDAT